jgi:hypothetical protein
MRPLHFRNQKYQREQNQRMGRNGRDKRQAVTRMHLARPRYFVIEKMIYFLLAIHRECGPTSDREYDGFATGSVSPDRQVDQLPRSRTTFLKPPSPAKVPRLR